MAKNKLLYPKNRKMVGGGVHFLRMEKNSEIKPPAFLNANLLFTVCTPNFSDLPPALLYYLVTTLVKQESPPRDAKIKSIVSINKLKAFFCKLIHTSQSNYNR